MNGTKVFVDGGSCVTDIETKNIEYILLFVVCVYAGNLKKWKIISNRVM